MAEEDRLDKSGYLSSLMMGRIYDARLLEACFTYWHSGIPLEKAREYLNTLENKLSKPPRQHPRFLNAGFHTDKRG